MSYYRLLSRIIAPSQGERSRNDVSDQHTFDYSNRNKAILLQTNKEVKPMPQTAVATPAPLKRREAGSFTRRIGSTNYRVGVHFSETSKETANDKIARLIRLEAQSGKTVD